MTEKNNGRKTYEQIEIPKELSAVVDEAISSIKKEEILKVEKKRNIMKAFRYCTAAAASLLVCMIICLNTSEVFAKEISKIPVIGSLAKVLTVRSYHSDEGDYSIDVEVPKISMETITETDPQNEASADVNTVYGEIGNAENDFTGDINVKINEIINSYTETAKADFENSKKAFFETGGTEEEWAGRQMDIYVDYNVKYQEGSVLSLELITAKTWVASEEERYYYNLDLVNNKNLSLQELLGEDYISIANESIKRQIEERIAADENNIYFGFNDDGMIQGFTTIDKNTLFYINEEGKAVVVFAKYEIAPGYMGWQEFVIS